MSLVRPDAPLRNLLPAIGLLLLLPVAVVMYYLLLQLDTYFGVLQTNAGILSDVQVSLSALLQALAFASGMAVAAVFYSFRFRFLIPVLLLALGLYGGYTVLQQTAVGEFDGFFLSVGFLTYGVLFSLGWIVGWGFVRWRYWHLLIAALLLVAGVFTIARFAPKTATDFIRQGLPLMVTAVYLAFMGEQIYRREASGTIFWRLALQRLAVFLLVVGAISLVAVTLFRPKLDETLARIGGTDSAGGKDRGMVREDSKGNMQLKNASSLQGSNRRSNDLVFIAYIDNFFPESEFPNPLYLNSFYYSKFDPATETFERDSVLPETDLFQPNIGAIPLFNTYTDSNIYRLQARHSLMKEVMVEVYSKKLSKTNFVGPHIGYQVQPITIEKDFKEQFQFAYRARSLSSELNSAYFVYNPQANAEIAKFQQDRFEILRRAATGPVSEPFRKYYTAVPADPKWNPVKTLAGQIAQGKRTTIDKVLAVRDYFTQKDASGNPLFSYSDNPGIPDIPSASRLLYFLFENRKGYCAYYAGATLFLLRMMGIPSRIAVGYLTVDRSGGKNKGWYWYYADQAHAWVQVYFPGYGWLDFDTTVGNSEAAESPQPDGTPPMQPPKAIYTLEGLVQRVDTAARTLSVRVGHLNYKDQPKPLSGSLTTALDVSKATIQQDTLRKTLADLHPDDTITAVTYVDVFKNPLPADDASMLLQKGPQPLPVDEIYVRPKVTPPKTDPQTVPEQAAVRTWPVWATILLVGAGLLLVWLLLPVLLLQYLRRNLRTAPDAKSETYWAARAARYRLYLLGVETRGSFSAFSQDADAALNTSLVTAFNRLYQQVRFSPRPLTAPEARQLSVFYPELENRIQQTFPANVRRNSLLKPLRALRYYWSQQEVG
ncbi:MAG: transglutaminase domain-containing protein [Sphingobacteriales bacterium]|nr:MAG: transglutaminase domain-containing protein [Sphingobacteriales bacterium]